MLKNFNSQTIYVLLYMANIFLVTDGAVHIARDPEEIDRCCSESMKNLCKATAAIGSGRN